MNFNYQRLASGGEFYADNAAGQRIAEISYLWRDEQTIIANHTWVDDSLRGQGVARQLLDELVRFAREHQLKIVATCSYVVVMFKRDKSFTDVMA